MYKLIPSPSSHISTWHSSGYEHFCIEFQPATTQTCHSCYSSCFHIPCCHLYKLNVIDHFSHLAFACLSCIFTRCLSNNNCSSLHHRFTLYPQGIPHPILLISPGGGTLSLLPDSVSPLAAPDLSLRQKPQHLCSLTMFFGVHQKPLTHFTVLSVFVLPFGVHRSTLGTEVLYTNTGQYYDEGLILQVSMVC